MDVDADAVAQAVAHRAAEAVLGQHGFGQLMSLLAGDAGPQQGLCPLVRGADRLVGRAHPIAGRAEEHRARHVGAIAVRPRAEIQHDALARLELRIAGHGMGAGRVRAGSHDRGERKALRAVAAHEVLQLDLHLALGEAGAHEADDVRESGVGDGLGRTQTRDLGRLLHRAQAAHEAGRLAQLAADAVARERRLEAAVLDKRDGILDAERPAPSRPLARRIAAPAQRRLGERGMGGTGIVHRHGALARRCGAGRFGVARIGVEHGIARRDEQRVGGLVVEDAIEGGEPRDVRGVAHEEGVDARVRARRAQTREARGGEGGCGTRGRAGHRRPPCSLPCPCP